MKIKLPPPKGTWDFVILAWSAYVVFDILFELCVRETEGAAQMLRAGDTVACGFFFADVVWRWLASDNKIGFWKWGWVDLIASIPTVDSLRWARLFRVFRICRIVRGLRSASRVAHYFFQNETKATIVIALTLLFGSLLVASVLILDAERETGAIATVPDALWWAITTVTTVGYGDKVPQTDFGHLVGAGLMFVGISLFSATSALLASRLLRSATKKSDPSAEARLARIEEGIARLEQSLDARKPREGGAECRVASDEAAAAPDTSAASAPSEKPHA